MTYTDAEVERVERAICAVYSRMHDQRAPYAVQAAKAAARAALAAMPARGAEQALREAAAAFERGLSPDCDGPERDALRAALAAPAPPDWLPIDSAPKDSEFIVWQESHKRVVTVTRMDAMGPDAVIEPYAGKWWRATHWRPLPAPPVKP